MNHEGFRRIHDALKGYGFSGSKVYPVPQEGTDVPYVTVVTAHYEHLQPAVVLEA